MIHSFDLRIRLFDDSFAQLLRHQYSGVIACKESIVRYIYHFLENFTNLLVNPSFLKFEFPLIGVEWEHQYIFDHR